MAWRIYNEVLERPAEWEIANTRFHASDLLFALAAILPAPLIWAYLEQPLELLGFAIAITISAAGFLTVVYHVVRASRMSRLPTIKQVRMIRSAARHPTELNFTPETH